MDLESLLTEVYVLIDDWYKAEVGSERPTRPGPPVRMSDSEILTLAVVEQWRVGVPWRSERSLVRYMQTHGTRMFPDMVDRSQFNARARDLWGILIKLQQYLAQRMTADDTVYEVADCLPIPAFSNAQAAWRKSHWLYESTMGRGGTSGGFFFGDHLLLVTTPTGVVTGWLLGTGYIQDRWLMEALLSARAGHSVLIGAPHHYKRAHEDRPLPPVGHIGPRQATGPYRGCPYLVDRGFNGRLWYPHWRTNFKAHVMSQPPSHSIEPPLHPAQRAWLNRHRQIVETVFALLGEVFDIKRLKAHSRWGQYARVAAKLAAHNLGMWLNASHHRPLLSTATLIT